MKIIFAFVVIGICSAIAEDAPYPPSGWRPQQRALLILPPQYGPPTNDAQATQDAVETLDKVNENVMARFRQEEGSDTGVYHVYLPDGRLQKVQYTTAPVKQISGNNYQQQHQTSGSNYQQFSQYRQTPSNFPNANVQANHLEVTGNNQNSFQGNQQQYNRYNAQQEFGETRQQAYTTNFRGNQQQYSPYPNQQFGESRQQAYSQNLGNQYLAPRVLQQNTGKEAESVDPSQLLAQYSQAKNQNNPANNYVASVQFTDVPPITGPIFAYSPSPLVRIVRYATNYQ